MHILLGQSEPENEKAINTSQSLCQGKMDRVLISPRQTDFFMIITRSLSHLYNVNSI